MTLKNILATLFGIAVLGACSADVNVISASDAKLGTLVGVRDPKGVITPSGQPGFLVFGPYIALEPGVYRIVAKGALQGTGKTAGMIDAIAQKGERVFGMKPIYSLTGGPDSTLASMVFEVDSAVTDAEFRIQVQGGTTGAFAGYELTKIASAGKK